jgi:hypothetical protein
MRMAKETCTANSGNAFEKSGEPAGTGRDQGLAAGAAALAVPGPPAPAIASARSIQPPPIVL